MWNICHIFFYFVELGCVFRKRQQFHISVWKKENKDAARLGAVGEKTKGGCVCRHNRQRASVSVRENWKKRWGKNLWFYGLSNHHSWDLLPNVKNNYNQTSKSRNDCIFAHFWIQFVHLFPQSRKYKTSIHRLHEVTVRNWKTMPMQETAAFKYCIND